MNELQIFDNKEFGQVRTLQIDGEPWFVGKDIAEALEYKNPQKAIRDHVDDEDRSLNEMFTPNGNQQLLTINESGLYSLILSSKMPNAKKFKRWVTSEVLPSLRKTGSYGDASRDIEQMKDEIRQLKDAIYLLTGHHQEPHFENRRRLLEYNAKKTRIRKNLLSYIIQKLSEITDRPSNILLSEAYMRMTEAGISPKDLQIEWADNHDGEEITAFDAICFDIEASKLIMDITFGTLSRIIFSHTTGVL